MEADELESGSGDTVNRVDQLLIGLGVAVIGIWGTFVSLIANPSKLSPYLTGQAADANSEGKPKRYLGPGLFFILSLLIFILVMYLLKVQAVPSAEPREVSEVVQSNAGYKVGYALAQLVDAFEQRVMSGNIWSAVVIVVPVYAFAVALALINRILIGWIAPRWTAAHAVGAALYNIGTIILWMAVIVLIGAVASGSLPRLVMAGLTGVAFLTVMGLTAVQTYQFVADLTDEVDYRLGILSIATPLAILGLVVVFVILLI